MKRVSSEECRERQGGRRWIVEHFMLHTRKKEKFLRDREELYELVMSFLLFSYFANDRFRFREERL